MTMLKYENGPRATIQHTPALAVLAGDVIVAGGLTLISDVDNPPGTGLPIRQGSMNVSGGIYSGVADGAIAVGTFVYWDAVNSKVTLAAGNTPLGWLVAGPTGIASAAGPAANNDLCFILHDPQAIYSNGNVPVATVAALGSIQGDAAPVAVGFVFVTGADATKGVKLPDAPAGSVVEVKNGAAAVLKVWPFLGDGINAIAVNSALSMASLTSAVFRKLDATTWITIPLVPS